MRERRLLASSWRYSAWMTAALLLDAGLTVADLRFVLYSCLLQVVERAKLDVAALVHVVEGGVQRRVLALQPLLLRVEPLNLSPQATLLRASGRQSSFEVLHLLLGQHDLLIELSLVLDLIRETLVLRLHRISVGPPRLLLDAVEVDAGAKSLVVSRHDLDRTVESARLREK